jgi:protocatechuate 3,4-dioxygenase beta subunit
LGIRERPQVPRTVTPREQQLTRRRLLELGLALPPLAYVAAGSDLIDEVAAAASAPLALTPEIADADDPTPTQTEGPFFTPRTPRRRSIIPSGAPGTRLTLTGRVLTTGGRPIPRALLDFWQADARGVYDNTGYRFRGHQLADARGRYTLQTVMPGPYTGRTRHIHVKAQAPRGRILTTQLYFPGEPRNQDDGLFVPALLVRGLRRVRGGRIARFDFVLAV